MKNFCILVLILFVHLAQAQDEKRSLTIDDLAGWKTIKDTRISNDGRYAAYQIAPLKGDGKLLWHDLNSLSVDTIQLGNKADFPPDSKQLVFQYAVPEDSLKQAKKKKLKPEEMPLPALGILDLQSKQTVRFDSLLATYHGKYNSPWLAFTTRPDSTITLKDKSTLADLTLYQFATGDTLCFHQVQQVASDLDGNTLFFQTHSGDSTKLVSLYSFDTKKAKPTLVFQREGDLKRLAVNKTGDQWAFLFSSDTTEIKQYKLWLGRGQNAPDTVASQYTKAIPANWSPSTNKSLRFAENDHLLYFGTAPIPAPEDTTEQEEKPVLDIWSWTDKELMPAQLINKKKELERSYLACVDLKTMEVRQLGDSVVREVNIDTKADNKYLLGRDNQPYLRASSWDGRFSADYYAVNTTNGTKRLIAADKSSCELSPAENYFIWWEPADSCYFVQDITQKEASPVALKAGQEIHFYREDMDMPMDAQAYGIAGWSKDDRFVYIYDRYDIWQFDPSGKQSPINKTNGYGRENRVELRYRKTDRELRHLENDQWLLASFNEKDKSKGFYSLQLKSKADPQALVSNEFNYSFLRKAKDADRYLWTRESTTEFYDVWESSSDFEQAHKLSDANPQQEDLIWPRKELVEWQSFSGEKLQGILYYPENMNPDSLYPMVVYYYEKNTRSLNDYFIPSPSRSIINRSFYPSNGYLVFVPDITYQTGYPGQSAYNAIISGVNYLLNTRNYINADKMGLQGQSWGGYQTAYLVTQTDMFAAAMAGAPVSNMTSAYGGIRWQTGLSRMFQYEHTQSRIGGTLWEKPMQYIENSPVFYAPKVHTPLLMMHNDKDGAVPWYQGIELFVALRRLDKPVWLLNYNNEPHNLKAESWANRIDLTKRMMQFFDHYLKDSPMPEWMEKGLPAIEKGKNLGY